MAILGPIVVCLALLLSESSLYQRALVYKIYPAMSSARVFVDLPLLKGKFVTAQVILLLLIFVVLIDLLIKNVLGHVLYFIYAMISLLLALSIKPTIEKEPIIIREHNYTFTPLFWFGVLGPLGCWAYYILVVLNKRKVLNDAICATLISWLRLVPALLTGFILGLVGQFTEVLGSLKQKLIRREFNSDNIVLDCCWESLGQGGSTDEIDLVRRAKFAWLLLVVFFSTVYWSL